MKKEIERLKLRQKYRNEVNPVLAEKHVPNDTYTFTDEYVFWLEEQLVKNIEVIPCCKSDSEQFVLFADWLQYNGKWDLPEKQADNFLKEKQKQN